MEKEVGGQVWVLFLALCLLYLEWLWALWWDLTSDLCLCFHKHDGIARLFTAEELRPSLNLRGAGRRRGWEVFLMPPLPPVSLRTPTSPPTSTWRGVSIKPGDLAGPGGALGARAGLTWSRQKCSVAQDDRIHLPQGSGEGGWRCMKVRSPGEWWSFHWS